MFGGPGYSKPTHQYGQSFGEEAEVLDGDALKSCPCGRGERELCDQHWAGAGFTIPYKEEEAGTDESPEHGAREAG